MLQTVADVGERRGCERQTVAPRAGRRERLLGDRRGIGPIHDHGVVRGIHHAEGDTVAQRLADLGAQAFEAHLEVQDRDLFAVHLDRRGGRDHPAHRVHRVIGRTLVDVADFLGKRRREERVAGLIRRQLRDRSNLAEHHTRLLDAVGRDETRLIDHVGLQAVQQHEAVVDDRAQLAALLGMLVPVTERTVVCRQ